jgi:hypothetical protein
MPRSRLHHEAALLHTRTHAHTHAHTDTHTHTRAHTHTSSRPWEDFEMRERPPESNVVGCFGLNPSTSEAVVREAFEKFGR